MIMIMYDIQSFRSLKIVVIMKRSTTNILDLQITIFTTPRFFLLLYTWFWFDIHPYVRTHQKKKKTNYAFAFNVKKIGLRYNAYFKVWNGKINTYILLYDFVLKTYIYIYILILTYFTFEVYQVTFPLGYRLYRFLYCYSIFFFRLVPSSDFHVWSTFLSILELWFMCLT